MKPQIGQTVILNGVYCKIIAVHPFGTVDVESPSGKYFRVSGLLF